MDLKSISAGELSALLEVQRSNISHILNGRNKPGAAFIEKLLLVFPELNARWLLTGQGNMVESELVLPESDRQEVLFKEEILEKKEPEKTIEKTMVTNSEPVKESLNVDTGERTEIEKMVLIFKDGTFSTYEQRTNKK